MTESRKKKKMGRPKKRGPKKKRKSRAKPKPKILKPRLSWNWKIVIVSNGKQVGYVGKYLDVKDAYKVFNECKDKNDKIIFESKVKNSHIIQSRKDEYLLLEKNVGNKTSSLLRNEYGEFIEQVSSNKKWLVLDKAEKKTEETFWVYGFDPRTDRKTFVWIFENVIKDGVNGKFDIKRLFLFKNKIIIRDDDNKLSMIICKTIGDGVRFYNMTEKFLKKDKLLNNIILCGNCNKISDIRKDLENDLMKLTGWNKRKIERNSTRA